MLRRPVIASIHAYHFFIAVESKKDKIPTMKPNTLCLVLFALLTYFASTLGVEAVVPPPDGDYPGRNTAEGHKALFSLTTGTDNTALGWLSLQALTTGNLNTGVGAWALALNTADYNTACGAAALLFNGTGTDNTATGTGALLFNTVGEGNTATGAFALYSNTEGDFNTANGEFALYFNTTGERNTAIGDSALYSNTEGSGNTAIGNPALLANTTGDDNTAIGASALRDNTTGFQNTATGANALSNNTGSGNTATGAFALNQNTTGSTNTANGSGALSSNVQGSDNTAIGYNAMQFTTSSSNTAVGFHALLFNNIACCNTAVGWAALEGSTGQSNIALGHEAGSNVETASNVICIGIDGANVDNSCYVGNIWQQPGGSQAVYVSASGKLGAQVSSKRFKDEIKRMEQASEVIYRLKPVSFRYKAEIEPARPRSFGLIAEDVEAVDPDLILRDKEGKPYTVRYDAVNAMLLNEFLKEHRKVQEQEATIAQLKSTLAKKETIDAHQQQQIEALTAGLQKVSAQLDASNPARQVVSNP